MKFNKISCFKILQEKAKMGEIPYKNIHKNVKTLS